MPHQCTDCGRAFADGSKEMLSGCPNCGGNTFQFRPNADPEELEDSPPPDEEAEPPEPPEPAGDSSVARTVGKAATTVRDLVGSEGQTAGAPEPAPAESTTAEANTAAEPTTPESTTSDPEPAAPSTDTDDAEDAAQASARSDIVEPDEVRAGADDPGPARTRAAERIPPSDDEGERPGLSQLRAELNEQFESIKVLEPGQYELNLMELYDREEYIIALQEDGKYTIQVPDGFGDG